MLFRSVVPIPKASPAYIKAPDQEPEGAPSHGITVSEFLGALDEKRQRFKALANAFFKQNDYTIMDLSPAEFGRLIAADTERYTRYIRELKLKPE